MELVAFCLPTNPLARRKLTLKDLVDAMAGFDKFGGWAIPFRDETGEQLVFKRPVVVERLRPLRSMAAAGRSSVASSTRWTASDISGPVPSPGIKVTR